MKTGMIWIIAMVISLAGLSQASFGQPPQPVVSSDFPNLIAMTRITGSIDYCGEAVPLSDAVTTEGLERELLLALWNRPQVVLWLKRSGRYFPHIEDILRQHNMPQDLKFIPIIESALRPHVASSKNAMGYWQFMKPTAIHYGLRVDDEVDERRNIYASTAAAVRYLKKLYEDFGSWTLATAAYNMGEQRLKTNIAEQRTQNFYDLYLSLETQRYLLKIIAAKLILSDPGRYGFAFSEQDYYRPIPTDQITVNNPTQTPIILLALAADTSYKTFKELNPQVRGNFLAAGEHKLLIPKGAAKNFSNKIKANYQQWKMEQAQTPLVQKLEYTVRAGDHLSGIADRYGVPYPQLLKWNNLHSGSVIHPGDRLVIYQNSP